MFDWIDAYWHFWRDLDAGGTRYYIAAVVTVFLLLGLLFVIMYALVGLSWLFRWTAPGRAFWHLYLRDRDEREAKRTAST